MAKEFLKSCTKGEWKWKMKKNNGPRQLFLLLLSFFLSSSTCLVMRLSVHCRPTLALFLLSVVMWLCNYEATYGIYCNQNTNIVYTTETKYTKHKSFAQIDKTKGNVKEGVDIKAMLNLILRKTDR